MLHIDGSAGEGGGQVLRTALGLSLVTGKSFRIERIRGGRAKPGLLRQHLTCVQAAMALSDAEVDGAELSSQTLTFRPRALKSGHFEFSIGTAGSTTLVVQSVLPALLRAPGKVTLGIEGGTHNGLSPPYEFLAQALVPQLRALGAMVEVRLRRHGFEPAGGGRLEVEVTPSALGSLELVQRGALQARQARAVVSSVPVKVANTELEVVREELGFSEAECQAEEVPGASPGNAVLLTMAYERVTDVFVGLGAQGLPGYKVARRVCGLIKKSLRTDAPVGEHLADQLLAPLALSAGGVFRTIEPSSHTRTQLELIPRFLDRELQVAAESTGSTFRITV